MHLTWRSRPELLKLLAGDAVEVGADTLQSGRVFERLIDSECGPKVGLPQLLLDDGCAGGVHHGTSRQMPLQCWQGIPVHLTEACDDVVLTAGRLWDFRGIWKREVYCDCLHCHVRWMVFCMTHRLYSEWWCLRSVCRVCCEQCSNIGRCVWVRS